MFFRRFLVVGSSLLICLSLLLTTAGTRGSAQDTSLNMYSTMERISAGGENGGGGSTSSISSDGRYIVFEATASDLLPGTIDDSRDVFLRDRQSSIFERVSVTSAEQATYNIGELTCPPVISGNGQYVAFMSMSDELAPGDDNGMPDIFVREAIGATSLISRTPDTDDGETSPSGNGASFNPAISADGRYVVFQSTSTNLTDNDLNRSIDIFLRDRETRVTELISITNEGLQGDDEDRIYGYSSVAVSDDGRYVAFSYKRLPIPGHPVKDGEYVYVRDRQANSIRVIALGSHPALSSDGRYLVFLSDDSLVPEDQNNTRDVYLFDQQMNRFERVSVTNGGQEAPEQEITSAPDISADGRYIVFESSYDGMTPGDSNGMSDIFLRDRLLRKTILVSGGVSGAAGDGFSYQPAINDEGTMVTFTSMAEDLVSNDGNGRADVFAMNLTELGVLPGQLILPRLFIPLVGN